MPTFNRFGERETMSDAQLFRLMHKAFSPKPRLVLTKSINMPIRRKAKPVRPVVVLKPKAPDDAKILIGAVDTAVSRGWITGHDGLEAQRLLAAGKQLSESMRNAILGKR